MKISKRVNPPIPEGMQIYDGGEVAGIHHRKAAASKFIRGRGHSLELVREPRNRHDPNAIQVFGSVAGLFGRKRLLLGYVPADMAEKVATAGVFDSILPRLRYLRLDGEYVTVSFEILGPKALLERYRPKRRKRSTKPKRKKSAADVIFDQVYHFIDESHSDYDCKKVAKTLFKQVFPEFLEKALTKSNMSMADLAEHEEGDDILDDIEDLIIDMVAEIFERLIEVRPQLQRSS